MVPRISIDFVVLILILPTAVTIFLLFCVLSSPWIVASRQFSMPASPLLSSFLEIESMSSLGCKALGIVLVLCSICLSSSFVHFRNGPEYLTRNQVLMHLIEFLQQSLVSWNFRVLLTFFFFLLYHLSLFDDVRFWDSKIFVIFFSECSDTFLIW